MFRRLRRATGIGKQIDATRLQHFVIRFGGRIMVMECESCGNCYTTVEGCGCQDSENSKECGLREPWCRCDENSMMESARTKRLHAASREMLDALWSALGWIEAEETKHGRPFGAGNAIRAAIKSATGASTK
jgi:hypothetical protein